MRGLFSKGSLQRFAADPRLGSQRTFMDYVKVGPSIQKRTKRIQQRLDPPRAPRGLQEELVEALVVPRGAGRRLHDLSPKCVVHYRGPQRFQPFPF
jgi:hypothetical protein